MLNPRLAAAAVALSALLSGAAAAGPDDDEEENMVMLKVEKGYFEGIGLGIDPRSYFRMLQKPFVVVDFYEDLTTNIGHAFAGDFRDELFNMPVIGPVKLTGERLIDYAEYTGLIEEDEE